MKGKGYVITGSIKAKADVTGAIYGTGISLPVPMYSEAHATDEVNVKRMYLYVTPSAPQSLVWVVPGNELTYDVESNMDWELT